MSESISVDVQSELLEGVSRTFALTIPQLPDPLRTVVSNAYLLCRIADTIEDEAALDAASKAQFHAQFIAAADGASEKANEFAEGLAPLLSRSASAEEINLILRTPEVLSVTAQFKSEQRAALIRCLNIMSSGMERFERNASRAGLKNMQEMNEYCYHVAGVVGEMLTELFASFEPAISARRDDMMKLAVNFGLGLQMTNILKDIWEDRERDASWLPHDVFLAHGCDLESATASDEGFADAVNELVGVAHAHLQQALNYTLMIPPHQTGMRKFCLWAIGMALLTLRKIAANPSHTSGQQVKISRRSVHTTVWLCNRLVTQDFLLRRLFGLVAWPLPEGKINGELPTYWAKD